MTGVQTCALPICFPVTIEEVSALIEKTIDTKTKSLHKYKLNEIDEVREDILGAGKKEWTTKGSWPYIRELFERTWGITVSPYMYTYSELPFPGVQGYTGLNSSSIQSGLCVKTYQSDIFNNWVNTEWIDGPNGINAVTAIKIDPESNSFQLDTLNLAKKVYDMLNRIAVSGGTYQDWIETVYTTLPLFYHLFVHLLHFYTYHQEKMIRKLLS